MLNYVYVTETDTDRQSEAFEPDPAEMETIATVEAILFGADKPLSPGSISRIAALEGVRPVRRAIETLNSRYEEVGASFRVVQIAGGYQMQSLPEYSDVLGRLHSSRSDSRLSQAAMETLAIIAYRQPALRADVEAIRGVSCGEVIRGLMEKNLVRIVGRADEIGRPMLYGTTRRFLEVFGLNRLDDLPNAERLRQPMAQVAEDDAAPTEADVAQADAGEPAESQPALEGTWQSDRPTPAADQTA